MPLLNFKNRPLSWSAISSFEYNPEQWYSKYILKQPSVDNLAMQFGKRFAESIEKREPLVPVDIYSEIEYKLECSFNKIKMIGFIDTHEPHSAFREYKTARTLWTQDKCNDHGQLKMYALMIFLIHKIRPEDLTIHLDCIQTKEDENFKIHFYDSKVHSFEVKLTMKDILLFGSRIMKTVKAMQEYVDNHA